MWNPQRLTTLWDSMTCCGDKFVPFVKFSYLTTVDGVISYGGKTNVTT
jgi:hypothetical protein